MCSSITMKFWYKEQILEVPRSSLKWNSTVLKSDPFIYLYKDKENFLIITVCADIITLIGNSTKNIIM